MQWWTAYMYMYLYRFFRLLYNNYTQKSHHIMTGSNTQVNLSNNNKSTIQSETCRFNTIYAAGMTNTRSILQLMIIADNY